MSSFTENQISKEIPLNGINYEWKLIPHQDWIVINEHTGDMSRSFFNPTLHMRFNLDSMPLVHNSTITSIPSFFGADQIHPIFVQSVPAPSSLVCLMIWLVVFCRRRAK